MPEYLAPDVYVEEIDTGSKPIEGVSTSTAGMLGVSERGPVNVPILVTSYGEYVRWFGDKLDPAIFVRPGSNPPDLHCFLPHAVEGFFTNGGKRLYITRVESNASQHASFQLHDRGSAASAATWLLRAAPEASGNTDQTALYVVNTNSVAPGTGGLADGDHIRIGDGSRAEYWNVEAAAVPGVQPAHHVALSFPLARTHNPVASSLTADNVYEVDRVLAAAPNSFDLAAAVPAGATVISVTAVANDIVVNDLLEIGTAVNPVQGHAEYRFVRGVVPAVPLLQITLDSPLQRDHQISLVGYISKLDPFGAAPAAPLTFDLQAVVAGTIEVTGALGEVAKDDLLEIGAGTPTPVFGFVTVSAMAGANLQITLNPPFGPAPAVLPQPSGYVRKHAVGAAPTLVPLAPGRRTTLEANHPVAPGDGMAFLDINGGLVNNRSHIVVFDPLDVANREARRIGELAVMTLGTPTADVYPAGTSVTRVTMAPNPAPVTPNPKALNADAAAGDTVVSLNNRIGLALNQVLQMSAGGTVEFAAVSQILNQDPLGAAPDIGLVVLTQPLSRDHANGTAVTVVTPTVDLSRPPTSLVLAANRGATQIVVADGGDAVIAVPADRYLNGEILRFVVPGVGTLYHPLADDAQAANAQPVRLVHPVTIPHAAGTPVAERTPLILVEAIDSGGWGNRLRVSVADEDTGSVARTPIAAAIGVNRIRLLTPTGVEPGTILEVRAVNGDALLATVKVMRIDRATGEATLDAAAQLTAAQVPTINGAAFYVRSREFSLTVRLLAAPDPSDPSRADVEIDREVFRYLSMDPRHSRYVETVIGQIAAPGVSLRLSDRRPDGDSWYIRVDDLAPNNTIRLGPEALTDLLANGTVQPARHALGGGDDGMATMGDPSYIGGDDANPENRTGLFSLKNIEDISIVAAPGRTSAAMQNALINHCELARYRFAVLDAQRPPHDAIADVINQRQQYDTKYAAIYHPWLLIPPPFPASSSQADEYAIPPSGHMIGVYARTDIERGVHKAPANEVVRGVVGLQRLLNKGEHDILNPYPININVIRDFRSNSRGIRVYGGRVITSDSDWKYVNVRRLLIFIEASINRGLQWVVFEPNAEPLWARVTRSISNFLTLVWRNGALEGTKVEEAYFVKCDRTTMTQMDIDSGRLICMVGVAPVKPAEFVVVRIGLWTAHADE